MIIVLRYYLNIFKYHTDCFRTKMDKYKSFKNLNKYTKNMLKYFLITKLITILLLKRDPIIFPFSYLNFSLKNKYKILKLVLTKLFKLILHNKLKKVYMKVYLNILMKYNMLKY